MRLVPVLVVAVLASACSSGTPKDLGCVSDLGSAENTYNDGVSGIGKTSTVEDAVKALATVKSKMDDFVAINDDPTIKAKAQDAADRAGSIRVALTDGGGMSAVSLTDVNAFRGDMTALEDRCTALKGK